jgi:hypothetical protein
MPSAIALPDAQDASRVFGSPDTRVETLTFQATPRPTGGFCQGRLKGLIDAILHDARFDWQLRH